MQRFRRYLTADDRALANVHPALDAEVVDALREPLSAHDGELRALLRTLPRQRSTNRTRVMGLSLALAIAAILLFMAGPSSEPVAPEYGPVPLAMHALVPTNTATQLGPSIQLQGVGELTVERAGPEGTEVHLTEGAYNFEVDPNGAFRDLVVVAGDVRTTVHGTRFSVQRLEGRVKVVVERGRVSVAHGGQIQYLTANQSWTRPAPIVDTKAQALPVPTVAALVATPAPSEGPTKTTAAASPSRDDAMALAGLLSSIEALHPEDALLAIDAFLALYPDSALHTEARLLRVELAVNMAGESGVLNEIDALLALPEAAHRRLDLLEARARFADTNLQDCSLAIVAWQQLAFETIGTRRAMALARGGLCMVQQDPDNVEGRLLLEHALSEGVKEPLRTRVSAELGAL